MQKDIPVRVFVGCYILKQEKCKYPYAGQKK